MKRLDTSTMDNKKLTEFVTTSQLELSTLKRNQALGQDNNTARSKALRRDIARALTALNQKKEEAK